MSLAQLLTILRGQFWSIMLTMLASAGIAFAFAESLPKQYTAKARLVLDIANNDPLQFTALRPKTEADYIGTQIRLASDIAVAKDVVEKLGWASDPSVIAAWQDATGGTGDVATWVGHRITANMAARQFEDSSILELYYSASSIDVAKQIAGLLRTAFIDNSQRMRVEAARRASAWNRTQAANALVALNRALAERLAFVRANQIPLDVAGGLEMRAMDGLQAKTVDKNGPRGLAASPEMNLLHNQLNLLDAQLAVMHDVGPANPDYLAATARRETIRAQLARETAFNNSGGSATAAAVAANAKTISDQYLKARLEVLDRAPLYDRLAQLNRDIRLKTSLYTAAAARVKNFDFMATAPSGIRVLGDVIADDDAVFPNVGLITGLAAAFGLGLGIAFALFGEMLQRRIRGAEDLHFYSQVPVLAVIAHTPRPRFRWPRWRRRLAAV